MSAGRRGGFSLYVPEATDARTPMPLVVALHGGSGHGRDFLWSWLADARSRQMLLLSPTARDRTWSIMGGEDVDAEPLAQMVESVAARYPVDRGRVLLTGMSDGATYALLCGLRDGMPFTHLAPVCGVLHPFLFAEGGIERARGRRSTSSTARSTGCSPSTPPGWRSRLSPRRARESSIARSRTCPTPIRATRTRRCSTGS